MGNTTAGPRGRMLAAATAVVLGSLLASCGLVAGPGERPSATAGAGGTGAAAGVAQPPPGTPTPTPTPTSTPTPTPTPGKGPGCAVARCASVLVTGDMLVHPQLWQQAREDARAAGAAGLDFGPLLEGQRRYIETSDVAVCHLETPVARPDGPFSGYPSFNVPPQIITAVRGVGYQACTTASNHTVDRGSPGLIRTLDALDDPPDCGTRARTGPWRSRREY